MEDELDALFDVSDSVYDISFSGIVEYAGDESWKSITRPVSFDSSVMELYAVTADGDIKLDLQSTNFSGNIYLQYVDGDDGGGTFNISKAPSKLNGVAVNSYKLRIPKSAYYSEANAEVTADNRAILTLNPITSGLTITKKVPGGVDVNANFPVKIALRTSSGSVTLEKMLTVSAGTESASVTVAVPAAVECTVSEILSGGSGYKLSSYAFSDDGNATFSESKDPISFTPEEVSEYFVEIINARYNTTVSWTVKWVDNNASDGRTPRFTLMYSLDGEEPAAFDDSCLELFGLNAVPAAVCSNPAASNNYRYSYSGLPNVVDGKTVTYTVAEEADGYICEYDSGSDTFINTLAAKLNAKIKWSDSAVNEARPSEDRVMAELRLYRCISGVYDDVTDEAGLSVSDGDTSEWTITVENPLPRYTLDNHGIEYALVFGTISVDGTATGATVPVSASIDEEGLEYVLTYNNGQGTYGNIFDRCYSGGTIVATISGTCDFEAQLKWLDNDSSIRPKAALTLMRYIMTDESDTEITAANLKKSTKVIAKSPDLDIQTVLTYEIPAASSENVSTISFNSLFPVGYSLPKFDENGARYFYFVQEVLDDGNETTYSVLYPDNENGAANGKTIQNVLNAETAIKVNKIWQAPSSLKDLEQAELKFTLICEDSEGNTYEIDAVSQGSNTLSGFGNSVSSKETVFVVSLRTADEKMLTPVGIKEYVTLNGSAVDCTYSDNGISAEFKIKDNTYVSSCVYKETAVSTEFDGIPMYVYEVTNSVKNLQDYTIKKVWGDGVTHQALNFNVTGKSEAGSVHARYKAEFSADSEGNPLVAKLTTEGGDVISENIPITASDDGKVWSAKFENVFPMFTADGYLITYTVSETSSGNWNNTSYSYTRESATVTNTIATGGPAMRLRFLKIWNDDGSTMYRQPVTVHIFIGNTDMAECMRNAASTADIPSELQSIITDETTLQKWKNYTWSVQLTQDQAWEKVLYLSIELKDLNVTAREVQIGSSTVVYPDDTGDKGTVSVGNFCFNAERTVENISETSKNITFTNTRTGKVNFELTQNWLDGAGTNRPSEVDSVLTRNKGKADAEVIVIRQTESSVRFGTLNESGVFTELTAEEQERWGIDISNASTVLKPKDGTVLYDRWVTSGIKLDKYDDNGKVYSYDLSGIDFTAADYEHKNEKFTHTQVLNTEDDPGWLDDKDEYVYSRDHKLVGTTSTHVYVLWQDSATGGNSRPDIYFTMYRSGADNVISEYHGSYIQTWTTGDPVSDRYHIEAVFGNLPKYDEWGNEYSYYIRETLGKNGASTGMTYVTKYYTSLDKSTESTTTDSSGAFLAEDGYLVLNLISDTMTYTVEKIWANLDEFASNEYPDLTLNLFRREKGTANSGTLNSYGIDDSWGTEPIAKHFLECSKGDKTYKFIEYDDNGEPKPLDKYSPNGKAYEYMVSETFNGEHSTLLVSLYKTNIGNNTITNTFDSENNNRTITVKKLWDRDDVDDDGQDDHSQDKYPAVKFNLYRFKESEEADFNSNHSKYLLKSKVILARDSKNGVCTFDDLLVFSPNGSRYFYYITETPITSYESEYFADGSGTVTADGSITADTQGILIKNIVSLGSNDVVTVSVKNTFVPQVIEVTGKKVWDDYKDIYHLRPDTDKIKLKISRKTVNEYMQGANQVNGISETVLIVGTAYDADKPYIEWTVDPSNEYWTYTVKNLRRYGSNGQVYTYIVTEIFDPTTEEWHKYYDISQPISASKDADKSNAVTKMGDLTNKFSKTHTLKKSWFDGSNKYGFRPDAIEVTLQCSTDGGNVWENVETKQLTAADCTVIGNSWTYVFKNLPEAKEVDGNAKECKYRIVENRLGYNGTFYEFKLCDDGINYQSGAYVREYIYEDSKTIIYNSMNSTELTVEKKWEDSENLYQTRPEKLEFHLQRAFLEDGRREPTESDWQNVQNGSEDIIITMTKANAKDADTWSLRIKDLAVKSPSGEYDLYYRVKEKTDANGHPDVSGTVYQNYNETTDYSTGWSFNIDSGNAMQVSNKLVTEDSSLTISAKITKVWHNDIQGPAANVTFELKYSIDGTTFKSYSPKLTKTLAADGTSDSVIWEKLPRVDKDGNTLYYTIVENAVSGYSTSYDSERDANGNYLLTCVNTELMQHTVKKEWINNSYCLLPNGYTKPTAKIKLMRSIDGENWVDVGSEFVCTIKGDGTYTFKNLPKFDADNKPYYYKAVETDINGIPVENARSYGVEYTYNYSVSDKKHGSETVITNTLNEVELQITKEWVDSSGTAVRPENIEFTLYADGSAVPGSGHSALVWEKNGDTWTAKYEHLPRYSYKTVGSVITESEIEYTVAETPVDGYYTEMSGYTDSTPVGNKTVRSVTVTNKSGLKLTLEKSDSFDSAKLSGVKFTLYKAQKNGSVYTRGAKLSDHTTDENGKISVLISDVGIYELAETAPTGYENSNFSLFFEVSDSDFNREIAVTSDVLNSSSPKFSASDASLLTENGLQNNRKTGTVIIIKQDGDTTAALDGTVFTLYKKNNASGFENLWNFITGNKYTKETQVNATSGVTTLTGLEWGEYKIVETTPVDGYKRSEAEFEFEINKDNVSEPIRLTSEFVDGKNIISNYKNSFKFVKKAADGTVLTGGEYRILYVNGESKTETEFYKSSDETGGKSDRITSGDTVFGLKPGPYEVQELKAPDGYEIAENVSFTIDENGNPVSAEVVMTDAPIAVSLKKIDSDSSKIIKGAKFSLTGIFAGSNGTETTMTDIAPAEFESVVSGKLIAGNSYTLTETTAPVGYGLPASSAVFTVNKDGTLTLMGNAGGSAVLDNSPSANAGVPCITVSDEVLYTDIKAVKKFAYENGWESYIRPDSITLVLYYKTSEMDEALPVEGKELDLDTSDLTKTEFEGEFTDLPLSLISADGTPLEIEYSIKEKVVPDDYTVSYSKTAENGNITLYAENTAALSGTFLKISNETVNAEMNTDPLDRKTNAGGSVTAGSVTDASSTDWQKDVTEVSWTAENGWVSADSFKVFYRDISDPAENEITVSGFLNDDGTPKDSGDSCYDALRTVYPDFTVSGQKDGTVTLSLAGNAAGMHYRNRAEITFVPTVLAENISELKPLGKVSLDRDNGYSENKTDRATQTAVYAKAADDCYVDIDNLYISPIDGLSSEADRRKLSIAEDGTFTAIIGTSIDGEAGEYEIKGSVNVLEKSSEDMPVLIKISFTEMPVPVDAGVKFVSPLASLKVTKVFTGDSLWVKSIRPKKISLQLYRTGTISGRNAVGSPVEISVSPDTDSYVHTFTELPLFAETGSGNVEKLSYSVQEIGSDRRYYDTSYSAVTSVSASKYETTVTNSADKLLPPGTLKITKINNGGPVAAEFDIEVKFGMDSDDMLLFCGSYDISDAETGNILRSGELTENGIIRLKGGETASLLLPNGAKYSVEEIADPNEVPKQYEVTYENQSGDIRSNEVFSVLITNSAVFYTGIENCTENPETGNTDIGGIVGIIRQLGSDEEYAEQSFDSVDYISEKLGVFWKPSEYWCYSDGFEVNYREFNSTEIKTVKVSGFMNPDGTLKDISDSCYDELRTRYPDFDIKINAKNAVVLYLSNRQEGMPYLNRVEVVFIPTIAVWNLTDNRLGGYVKLSEGGYNPEYVGRLAGGTEAAALADDGYYIDISEIRLGRAGQTGTLINADSNGRFTISLGEKTARSTASLNVTGSIAVLQSDSFGNPVEAAVTLDELMVPLDIGIIFKKAPEETTVTSEITTETTMATTTETTSETTSEESSETTFAPPETSTTVSHTIQTGTVLPPTPGQTESSQTNDSEPDETDDIAAGAGIYGDGYTIIDLPEEERPLLGYIAAVILGSLAAVLSIIIISKHNKKQ